MEMQETTTVKTSKIKVVLYVIGTVIATSVLLVLALAGVIGAGNAVDGASYNPLPDKYDNMFTASFCIAFFVILGIAVLLGTIFFIRDAMAAKKASRSIKSGYIIWFTSAVTTVALPLLLLAFVVIYTAVFGGDPFP